MGTSKTVIGVKRDPLPPVTGRRLEEEEIDYEAESIPLETGEASFESLENFGEAIGVNANAGARSETAATSVQPDGSEPDLRIRSRISSLLDRAESPSGAREARLTDLSALSEQ
ncbi:MAG: hypothetical protein LBK65_03985 [Tannerellaceae bacterium]|nr:hypothetical protein [Tannerellaceae bacterium]